MAIGLDRRMPRWKQGADGRHVVARSERFGCFIEVDIDEPAFVRPVVTDRTEFSRFR